MEWQALHKVPFCERKDVSTATDSPRKRGPTLLGRHHLAADEHLEALEALDVPRERLHKRLFRELVRLHVEVYQSAQMRGRGGDLREWQLAKEKGSERMFRRTLIPPSPLPSL